MWLHDLTTGLVIPDELLAGLQIDAPKGRQVREILVALGVVHTNLDEADLRSKLLFQLLRLTNVFSYLWACDMSTS